MGWIKKGLIFQAEGGPAWMSTHAALPVADPIADDLFAVYFSSRDWNGRAQIGRFDFRLNDVGCVTLHPEPCIRLGPLGCFDDSGVTSSCVIEHAGRKYQYYSGWSLGVTVPFYFYIGLAISEDGGRTFEKISASPVLGRDATDPYLTASPCVMVEQGVWRMWYVSGVRWSMEDRKPKHYYHIKYAESLDGVRWSDRRPVCIDFHSPDEYAIARPCVIKQGGLYRMWYCSRGAAYRIGYAESADGVKWERLDAQAGITVSESGWDSEMTAYPWVFSHKSTNYMLYNGNGYGRTGIGLAESDCRVDS